MEMEAYSGKHMWTSGSCCNCQHWIMVSSQGSQENFLSPATQQVISMMVQIGRMNLPCLAVPTGDGTDESSLPLE